MTKRFSLILGSLLIMSFLLVADAGLQAAQKRCGIYVYNRSPHKMLTVKVKYKRNGINKIKVISLRRGGRTNVTVDRNQVVRFTYKGKTVTLKIGPRQASTRISLYDDKAIVRQATVYIYNRSKMSRIPMKVVYTKRGKKVVENVILKRGRRQYFRVDRNTTFRYSYMGKRVQKKIKPGQSSVTLNVR